MIRELTAHPGISGDPCELAVDELAYGVALVIYHLGGTARASIWIRENGRWQLRYHQGTQLTAMSETR